MKTSKPKGFKWANWFKITDKPSIKKTQCKLCDNVATYIAVAKKKTLQEVEEILIKALCETHYNHTNQKNWLKAWRKEYVDERVFITREIVGIGQEIVDYLASTKINGKELAEQIEFLIIKKMKLDESDLSFIPPQKGEL